MPKIRGLRSARPGFPPVGASISGRPPRVVGMRAEQHVVDLRSVGHPPTEPILRLGPLANHGCLSQRNQLCVHLHPHVSRGGCSACSSGGCGFSPWGLLTSTSHAWPRHEAWRGREGCPTVCTIVASLSAMACLICWYDRRILWRTRWAQDIAAHLPTRDPQPNPDLRPRRGLSRCPSQSPPFSDEPWLLR